MVDFTSNRTMIGSPAPSFEQVHELDRRMRVLRLVRKEPGTAM